MLIFRHLHLTDSPILSNMPAQFNRILPLWKNLSSGLLFSPLRQPSKLNSQVAYARPTPNTTAATTTATTAGPITEPRNISGPGGISPGNQPSSRGTRPTSLKRTWFTRIVRPSFGTILQPNTPVSGFVTLTGGKTRYDARTGSYRGSISAKATSVQVIGGVNIVQKARALTRYDAKTGSYLGSSSL